MLSVDAYLYRNSDSKAYQQQILAAIVVQDGLKRQEDQRQPPQEDESNPLHVGPEMQ